MAKIFMTETAFIFIYRRSPPYQTRFSGSFQAICCQRMAFILKPGSNRLERKLQEGDEPIKTLESEGDKFIKDRVKKQTDTKITLNQALEQQKEFVKGVGYVTLKDGGKKNLNEFKKILDTISSKENATSSTKTGASQSFREFKITRQEREAALALKPNSAKTKLLAFALGVVNEKKKVRDPVLDNLSQQLEASPRALAKSIIKKRRELTCDHLHDEPKVEDISVEAGSVHPSQWDVKKVKRPKIYTCEQPAPSERLSCEEEEPLAREDDNITFVTDNSINSVQLGEMTDKEIRLLPHFSDYSRGEPSSSLYIKNLKRNVKEERFAAIIAAALSKSSISPMGVTYTLHPHQAFIHFNNTGDATKMLESLNGTDVNGKRLIVQYSTSKRC